MPPQNVCRICAGELDLVRPGGPGALTPAQLGPVEHARGAHGGFLACRECGTLQPSSLPPGDALLVRYRRNARRGRWTLLRRPAARLEAVGEARPVGLPGAA